MIPAIVFAGGLEKIANFLQHLHVSSLVIRSNHLSEHAVGAIAGVTTLQRLDLQYSTVKGKPASWEAFYPIRADCLFNVLYQLFYLQISGRFRVFEV